MHIGLLSMHCLFLQSMLIYTILGFVCFLNQSLSHTSSDEQELENSKQLKSGIYTIDQHCPVFFSWQKLKHNGGTKWNKIHSSFTPTPLLLETATLFTLWLQKWSLLSVVLMKSYEPHSNICVLQVPSAWLPIVHSPYYQINLHRNNLISHMTYVR